MVLLLLLLLLMDDGTNNADGGRNGPQCRCWLCTQWMNAWKGGEEVVVEEGYVMMLYFNKILCVCVCVL